MHALLLAAIEKTSPIECCINEVNEEAGFDINESNIKQMVKNIGTTQMNEKGI